MRPKGLGTICVIRFGCFRAASRIWCASAAFNAMRASVRTCLPACNAANVMGQCKYGHVPITTASIFGSPTRSCQRPWVRGMPNSLTTARVDSGRRLHTATISTPAMARKPGMCFFRVFSPAPMMPMRNICLVFSKPRDCRPWAFLPLDHPNRSHSRHLARQAGVVDHIHHVIDVLIGARLLFRKAAPALGAGDHAARFQFFVDAAAARVLHGRRAAHGSAGPVAGGAESLLHAAGRADENPTGAPHVAGNYYRLADVAKDRRQFGMAGRERARRPLAMHPDFFPYAANVVFFQLRDVVGHVVQQVHAQILPRATEHIGKNFAGLGHQQLPVAEAEVRGRAHGADVTLAFVALDGSAGQLPIGQVDAVLLRRLAKHGQGIVADLVTQAARAGMDHNAHLILLETERACNAFVENVIDNLHLHEMIAGAQRAALLGPARESVIADFIRVGVLNLAGRLGVFEIRRRAETPANHVAGTIGEQVPQFLLVELVLARTADACGYVAEQALDQFPQMRLHVLVKEIALDEAHAAVDVVAHAAGGDHAAFVGISGAHAADAEAIAPVNIGHGHAGQLDARQKRDVRDLLRRLVLANLLNHSLAGEDQAIHAHALLVLPGNAPATIVDLFERTAVVFLWHDDSPARINCNGPRKNTDFVTRMNTDKNVLEFI